MNLDKLWRFLWSGVVYWVKWQIISEQDDFIWNLFIVTGFNNKMTLCLRNERCGWFKMFFFLSTAEAKCRCGFHIMLVHNIKEIVPPPKKTKKSKNLLMVMMFQTSMNLFVKPKLNFCRILWLLFSIWQVNGMRDCQDSKTQKHHKFIMKIVEVNHVLFSKSCELSWTDRNCYRSCC